jgi:hypothetical protein
MADLVRTLGHGKPVELGIYLLSWVSIWAAAGPPIAIGNSITTFVPEPDPGPYPSPKILARSQLSDDVDKLAQIRCAIAFSHDPRRACARVAAVRCGWRLLDGHQPRCTDQVTLCTEVDQICRIAASQERMLMCSPTCLRCGLRQSPAAEISGLTSPLTISAKQLPTRSGEGLCRRLHADQS